MNLHENSTDLELAQVRRERNHARTRVEFPRGSSHNDTHILASPHIRTLAELSSEYAPHREHDTESQGGRT